MLLLLLFKTKWVSASIIAVVAVGAACQWPKCCDAVVVVVAVVAVVVVAVVAVVAVFCC